MDISKNINELNIKLQNSGKSIAVMFDIIEGLGIFKPDIEVVVV